MKETLAVKIIHGVYGAKHYQEDKDKPGTSDRLLVDDVSVLKTMGMSLRKRAVVHT